MTLKEALSFIENDPEKRIVRKSWLNKPITEEHSAAMLSMDDILADDWEVKKRYHNLREYNVRIWLDESFVPNNARPESWLKGKLLYANIPGMDILHVSAVMYKDRDEWGTFDPNIPQQGSC